MKDKKYQYIRSYIRKVILKDNKLYIPKYDLSRKCLLDLLSKDKEINKKYIELGGDIKNTVFISDKIIADNRKKIKKAKQIEIEDRLSNSEDHV